MQLLPQQLQKISEIIQKHNLTFLCQYVGTDFLLPSDIDLLNRHGIDALKLYNPVSDKLYSSFHLGMLVEALGLKEAMKWNYDELIEYLTHNPLRLTHRQNYVLNSVKNQSFGDIKGLGNKIFNDVNNILNTNTRKEQEKFLREEIKQGLLDGETVKNIANEISSKTGDWSRNFDRIVEYVSNTAYQEGKAEYLKNFYGDDVLVWKRVYASACKHCIRLYLTNGFGSKPIIFKLTELQANGNNIGRPVEKWKPVVGSTHPHCRCSLNYYDSRYDWNDKTQEFDILIDKEYVPKVKRKSKVKISIGKKVYEV
jgi:hypothetical protein